MDRFNISKGATVYDANGDKLGKVIDVQGQSLVVEKGFFFPTDYIVPTSLVTSATDDEVRLSVTKDQAIDSNQSIDDTTDYGTTVTDSTAPLSGARTGDVAYADTLATGTGYTNDVTGSGSYADNTGTTGTIGGDFDAAGTDSAQTSGDVLRVPVHEEELTATKRAVDAGQVHVTKDVITEDRTLEVPVTEERVRVTRRTVDRDATDTGDAFDERTIDVPVTSEAVDVQKRVRVAEEVDIAKEAVQRTQRVADTVRREEVRVEDQTTGGVTIDQ